MERYKPIKAKKTSDLAVEAIWELIHTGELNPGDKLPLSGSWQNGSAYP